MGLVVNLMTESLASSYQGNGTQHGYSRCSPSSENDNADMPLLVYPPANHRHPALEDLGRLARRWPLLEQRFARPSVEQLLIEVSP